MYIAKSLATFLSEQVSSLPKDIFSSLKIRGETRETLNKKQSSRSKENVAEVNAFISEDSIQLLC